MPIRPGSIAVPDSAPVQGESRPRRAACAPQLVDRPDDSVKTLYDVVARSARLYGNTNALGSRKLLHVHEEERPVTKTIKGQSVTESKKWSFFELSDYSYISYQGFLDRAQHAGSGLAALGLDRSRYFVNYSETSPNWQLLAYACVSQSITFATAYETLGKDGIQHAITEPEAVGIFTNANLLPMLSSVVSDTPSLTVLVYDGDANASPEVSQALQDIKNARNGAITAISFDDLIALGKEKNNPLVLPQPDDVATIMYTSGSTGPPKGVLLTHRNLVSAIGAVFTLLGDVVVPGESYMAYLPLAHIMEFVVETCMIYVGIPLGYGNIKTLTDTSCRNCYGDLRTFRPSIMVGVPAVWDTIKKGIQAKVASGGFLKSKIFDTAMSLKRTSKFLFGGITDAVVFSAVKSATGGRLKYALSGGAALSKETQEFLSISVLCLIQGYGMTECSAMAAILPPSMHRYDSVGVPSPAVEIKLRDAPDANYLTSNDPPQGEILVRGPAVTSGYFKREELDAELFTEDGFLITGDVGQWNPDGTLSLIDRKKNLVKLSGGEYIAIERLEAIYKSSSLVSNIFVYADVTAKQPMAVIYPHEDNLRNRVKQKELAPETEDLATLCKDESVREEVLKDANSKGKANGFKPLEILQCAVLTEEMWTPQNGLTTAAQKLDRKALFKRYEKEINSMYP